ncbi:hypothetical protein DH2020_031274 [Rehmannia glutinosa]|uniref:Uncharacterized protein n=1 Tax=Rehmannia glutinosa TaxID=99300 RepID=A0ABR0VIF5_REHGL
MGGLVFQHSADGGINSCFCDSRSGSNGGGDGDSGFYVGGHERPREVFVKERKGRGRLLGVLGRGNLELRGYKRKPKRKRLNRAVKMDESEKSISKEEAEIKNSGDEGKTEEGTAVDLGRAPEAEPPLVESVFKPVVEEFTQTAKSVASSCVTEVKKGVDKLVHVSESSLKGIVDTLPISSEKVGETSEAVKSKSAETEEAGLDENPRSTHTQVR